MIKEDSFKEKALTWDKSQMQINMTTNFVKELCDSIFLYKSDNILEVGCGTGLVGLQIAPNVNNMVLLDSSPAMIEVLNEKLESQPYDNVETVTGELEDLTRDNFNGIFTFMALHHIENIDTFISQCKVKLDNNGFLAIGDIIEEDGSFHSSNMNIPHKGFNLDLLSKKLENQGFILLRKQIYDKVVKNDKEYPLFILIAQK